jgi:putative ABC transport system ATP-binding protein
MARTDDETRDTALSDTLHDDALQGVALHGAARDVVADAAPAQARDEFTERVFAAFEDGEETTAGALGALDVLRRGVATSPELRVGLRATIVFAIVAAIGKLAIPILIQLILDRGVLGSSGFRPQFVLLTCLAAVVITITVLIVSRTAYYRLVLAAEQALCNLRVRVFEHIHRLSMAEHTNTRRGVFVSRVTSDIETLARFVQWGMISWLVNGTLIVGTIIVMFVYSWQLTLITLVAYAPVIPLFRAFQRRQLEAYDEERTRIGDMIAEFSETVTGAAVIRAYGLQDRARVRLRERIDGAYRARVRAAVYFAAMFPLGDFFGAIALAGVVVAAAYYGTDWGLDVGKVVAFMFLINLVLSPIGELSEILDQTQTAIAGWRKVLAVLEVPIDVAEPVDGVHLASGALDVMVSRLSFAYRGDAPVLHDVSVDIHAGTHVAVVGETGSGKTTFAKLLCRLADPTAGEVHIGGNDLRAVDAGSRRRAVRMVPQDGFLFDTTIAENVRMADPDATDDDIERAFARLGLEWWLLRLPDGLTTMVGERGESLSVGERQLVAIVRAELGNPGLLVLDEATSAVDPETERALAGALSRVSRGRTTVSIAHRLSTAEHADRVLVFDAGRIVESGTHEELVSTDGPYSALYRSWTANTTANGVTP